LRDEKAAKIISEVQAGGSDTDSDDQGILILSNLSETSVVGESY
jgi:hypothetical protein